MTRGRILIFVQWGVSITLVWYLLSRINFEDSITTLSNVNFLILLMSVIQLTLQPVLSALRWILIVRALGGELRYASALRFVWIGTFFSQAMPGVIGGDMVRIWLHWRNGAGHRLAINSVTLGSVIMMLSLAALVATVQPGLVARSESLVATWLPPLILAAAVCGVTVLMLSDRLVKRFLQWRPFRAIAYLAADSRKTLLHPYICTAVVLLSILAYLNMATTVWLIALALGLKVSLSDCVVLVPVAVLAATLPISIGGWGVREGAIVALFATVGVPSANSLALGVLFGFAGVLVSLPGVMIWLYGGYRRSDLAEVAVIAAGEPLKN